MSMKNSNNIVGNRTRDLPACSTVPQPAAPRRSPLNVITEANSEMLLLLILTGCINSVRLNKRLTSQIRNALLDQELKGNIWRVSTLYTGFWDITPCIY
jgi:hypothetical protein